MASSSSSSSNKDQDEDQKQESRDEYELKKDDQFERLPDDLVILIINKLIHIKSLIRFSLVSKRFFSLVPQTDSLFVDLDMDYRDRRQGFLGLVGGLLSNLVAKFTRASNMANSNRQKYYARFHRFQQVKHLHLHHGINFASFKPLTRWVAVFGSHLEFCHLLISSSANQFNSNVDASVAGITSSSHNMPALDNEYVEFLFTMLKNIFVIASMTQTFIKELVSEFKMLETVVFSDYQCLKGMFIMEKGQVSRLRGDQEEVSVDPAELRVLVHNVATLDIPESGDTMNNVKSVFIIPFNQDAKNVQVMYSEAKKTLKVSLPDGVELENYLKVFDQVVLEITSENRAPEYDSHIPYEQLLPNRN